MIPLISIVIPVYNSGHKIDKCIKSIFSQTHHNVEIILVDDKSPDNDTICILKDWATKDKRIKLILKEENGGNVRGIGVQASRGDYICFADQDDWMPNNALEVMLKAAEKENADVVVGQVGKAIKIGCIEKTFSPNRIVPFTGKVLTHETLMGDLYNSYFGYTILPVSVWAKLYRRDLFERTKFPDPWPKAVAGDLIMSMSLHENIQRMAIIPETVYDYYIGMPGTSPKYLDKWLPDACILFDYKWRFIEEHNIPQAKRYQAIEMINYVVFYVRNSTIYDYKNRTSRIQVLKETLNNPIWQKVGILKDNEWDPQLRDMIVQKKGREIFELVERQTLSAPLKTRMLYPLKRLAVKLKLFS